MLEYQRHSESGNDKCACQEMTKVRICAVMVVNGCGMEDVDKARRQWYRLAGGRKSGKENGCQVSFQLPWQEQRQTSLEGTHELYSGDMSSAPAHLEQIEFGTGASTKVMAIRFDAVPGEPKEKMTRCL